MIETVGALIQCSRDPARAAKTIARAALMALMLYTGAERAAEYMYALADEMSDAVAAQNRLRS